LRFLALARLSPTPVPVFPDLAAADDEDIGAHDHP
jgi:hypothetical protein